MAAHLAQPVRERVVIRRCQSPFAGRREHFGLLQTPAANLSESAHLPAMQPDDRPMAAVFDDRQVVRRGDLGDRIHVRRVPEPVHRHDGPGAWADLRPDIIRVNRDRLPVHVGKNGYRAGQQHCVRGRLKRQRRDDDLVAGPDAHGEQRRVLGRGPRAEGHGVPGVDVSGKLAFQALDLDRLFVDRAELPGLEYPIDGLLLSFVPRDD